MNRRIRGGKNVPPRYAAKIEQALSDHLRQGSLHLAGQTNTSINDSFTLQVETNTSDDAFFTEQFHKIGVVHIIIFPLYIKFPPWL